MTVYNALIATKNAVADYSQETVQAIADWRGRCLLNGTRNTLFGVGGIGTLVTIYEFANPWIQNTAPGWMIGIVVGGVSAITIVAGICLCASSPPKFEEIVIQLRENLDRYEAENARLRKNVIKFDGELDRFETLKEDTQAMFQGLEERLDFGITSIESARDGLQHATHEMQESHTAIGNNTSKLEDQIERLEILSQTFSKQGQAQSNSNYSLNGPDHVAIDIDDAQARLARHQAYLTQCVGSTNNGQT